MHEMALVRNVMDIVLEKAKAADVKEVKSVRLAIGMSRDIVEDYFEGLFQYLSRGTVAENAQIIIDRIPNTVKCNQCGVVFPLNMFDRKSWKCPHCGVERDFTMITGREFLIRDIEVAYAEPALRAG